jgi:hypothetical protein
MIGNWGFRPYELEELLTNREVLSQQRVGMFVRAGLSGILRITEVGVHFCGDCESLVLGHL